MPDTDIYEAKEAFNTILDGSPIAVRKGARVRVGHPLLQGREELFSPIDTVDFEWDGPTPEVRRGPGRPRKHPVG